MGHKSSTYVVAKNISKRVLSFHMSDKLIEQIDSDRDSMREKKTCIRSIGSYLPSTILTNQDLEKMVDTSDEWIQTRTGMKERRIASAEESPGYMGIQAAKRALESAKIDPLSIDLIITTTISPEYFCPSTAAVIQDGIQATNAAAFDLSAACSGFIYGLATAHSFLSAGLAKTILLVSTEKNSAFVDYTDRNTCVLFGDGAAACVITKGGPGLLLRALDIGADGTQGHLIQIPAGAGKTPASLETVAAKLHYIKMNGRETFKHAVRRMEQSIKTSLNRASVQENELRWLVPHQANIRIIEPLASRFNFPPERISITLDMLGNTSSASIPLSLEKVMLSKTVEPHDLLLLVAFGGGLTWGSAILEAHTNEEENQ